MPRNQSARIPELDGLRGVAILLVFAYHSCGSNTPQFQAFCRNASPAGRLFVGIANMGWSGVDLFFVLSGFLITGILLDARGSSNYFRVFYFRRFLRIFPIYYLSLIALFCLAPMLPPGLHIIGRYGWREQAWYWLNLSNLHSAFHPVAVPVLTHYWTLAIEEQFYLVWPWVVARFGGRRLLLVSIVGIVAATILRNLPAVQQINATYDNFIYRFTPFRVDSLLFGAILAIAVKHGLGRRESIQWIIASLAAGVGLLTLAMRVGGMTRYGYTGLALISASLVLACAIWSGRRVVGVFRLTALRELGRYSYCIYIIHPFIIARSWRIVGPWMHYRAFFPSYPYASLISLAGIDLLTAYVLARISWALIEGPALNFRGYLRYERPPALQEA